MKQIIISLFFILFLTMPVFSKSASDLNCTYLYPGREEIGDPTRSVIIVESYDGLKPLQGEKCSDIGDCKLLKTYSNQIAEDSDTIHIPGRIACAKLVSDILKKSGKQDDPCAKYKTSGTCKKDTINSCKWSDVDSFCYSVDYVEDNANKVEGTCVYWDTVRCTCGEGYKLKRTPLNKMKDQDIQKYVSPDNTSNIFWSNIGESYKPPFDYVTDVRDYFYKAWRNNIVTVDTNGKCVYYSKKRVEGKCDELGTAKDETECKKLAELCDDGVCIQGNYVYIPSTGKCYSPSTCEDYDNVEEVSCNTDGKCLYTLSSEQVKKTPQECKSDNDCTDPPENWLKDAIIAKCITPKPIESVLGKFWVGTKTGSSAGPDPGSEIGTGEGCPIGGAFYKEGNSMKALTEKKFVKWIMTFISDYHYLPLTDYVKDTNVQPTLAEWIASEDCQKIPASPECYDTAKKIQVIQKEYDVIDDCYYRNDMDYAYLAECVPETKEVIKEPNEYVCPESCDDGNPCTIDYCTDGKKGCEYSFVQTGTPCGDNKICIGGKCVDNSCNTSGDCDDKNPCTVDQCILSAGPKNVCSWSNLEDGTDCTSEAGHPGKCISGKCVEQECPKCNDFIIDEEYKTNPFSRNLPPIKYCYYYTPDKTPVFCSPVDKAEEACEKELSGQVCPPCGTYSVKDIRVVITPNSGDIIYNGKDIDFKGDGIVRVDGVPYKLTNGDTVPGTDLTYSADESGGVLVSPQKCTYFEDGKKVFTSTLEEAEAECIKNLCGTIKCPTICDEDTLKEECADYLGGVKCPSCDNLSVSYDFVNDTCKYYKEKDGEIFSAKPDDAKEECNKVLENMGLLIKDITCPSCDNLNVFYDIIEDTCKYYKGTTVVFSAKPNEAEEKCKKELKGMKSKSFPEFKCPSCDNLDVSYNFVDNNCEYYKEEMKMFSAKPDEVSEKCSETIGKASETTSAIPETHPLLIILLLLGIVFVLNKKRK